MADNLTTSKPIRFVIPWYGEKIAGGAEALCRGFAQALAGKGVLVEILTTCAYDSQSDWNRNYHKPGKTKEGNVTVHRFPVRKRDTRSFNAINYKILNHSTLSPKEETKFFNESIRSIEMEKHIEQTSADSPIIFLPYCFGTTVYGVKAANGNQTLLPCLHQEGYAQLNITRKMFDSSNKFIFNSKPEQELAQKLFEMKDKKTCVLGMGIDGFDNPGNPENFRKRYKIERPFLLYLGRKDPTKNLPLLLTYIQHLLLIENFNIDFVIAGPDKIDLPPQLSRRIHDLGLLSESDKRDAISACLALTQPSLRESLGIVLLEAWRESRPVIVNDLCDVTRDLTEYANGGLYFRDYFEFRSVVETLLSQPELAEKLGKQGQEYTQKECTWDALLEKLTSFLRN